MAEDPAGRLLRSPATYVASWIVAVVVALVAAFQRYHAVAGSTPGADYSAFYLGAAREIAAGRTPYSVGGYIYSPVLAWLMRPLLHIDAQLAWRLWSAASCLGLLVAVAAFTAAARLPRRWAPVLVVLASVTAFHFWPTTTLFFTGGVDGVVLGVLAVAVLLLVDDRAVGSGVAVGVAGIIKTWPIACGLPILFSERVSRAKVLLAMLITFLVAPLSALLLGGFDELGSFISTTVGHSKLHLIAHSVIGTAELNFTDSGLAHPLVRSRPLEVLFVLVFLVVLLGLALVAVRSAPDRIIAFWNFTACLVLLLPVSHLWYGVYQLPVLWWWGSRLMRPSTRSGLAVGVLAVVACWWLVENKAWPDNGSAVTISSIRYSVVFGAGLVAVAASVLGARHLARRGLPVLA